MKIKTVIIEDEITALQHLQKILSQVSFDFDVIKVLSSVKTATEWFQNNQKPDLIFMDIQLSDGISFQILENVIIDTSIIFTTAYDQYAIKAFKTTGIDYLLKPITKEDVNISVSKFVEKFAIYNDSSFLKNIDLVNQLKTKEHYKKRFLLKDGKKYTPVNIEQIAYFYRDESVFVKLKNGDSYIIDESLEQLQKELNPNHFIRLHRKLLTNISAIKSLKNYKPGRFVVELEPTYEDGIYLSQERSSWLRNFYS
ncbi:LytTR family DNA-binding domain-containing protein [uncultured Aquimarina sp.]|uniref:LytR/AlgR family response regulator transcription factor n=1 Tax=uncultured Aquimarina sp. TaxID=575652 RepID=UPI002602D2EE|nr:LytTR family DNA-binding domain-containing protein [uncultured Aquimarina sp.]